MQSYKLVIVLTKSQADMNAMAGIMNKLKTDKEDTLE